MIMTFSSQEGCCCDMVLETAMLQFSRVMCDSSAESSEELMQEKRRVLYKKGVFVCPGCRQSYVQEKWIEEWRIRCHRCTYRGTLTEVSVEEHMEEETFRH
jgi:hypothetical protein